jgi:hypothetical protein
MSALSRREPTRKSSTSCPVGPGASASALEGLDFPCFRRLGRESVVGVLGTDEAGEDSASSDMTSLDVALHGERMSWLSSVTTSVSL